MRYSQLFGKTSKTAPADADSVNAKFLTQAGFIQKQMAGVYSYLPLGLRVLKKIQDIIREEMNALGAQEMLMPALTQKETWAITKREKMDVLYHLKGHGDANLVLNPTHEEIVTGVAQKYISSYRDLPLAVYQIQDKFRNEPRAKSGLLRGREFSMKDLYSFHADEKDLDAYYEKATQAYHNIYKRLGIGDRTVLTFASGGVFSKYSHEFQTLCDIGEDTVHLCEKCRVAVNDELINEQKVCPNCGNTKLVPQKAIEVGNIFKLRTRFSEVLGLKYKDEKGTEHAVEMGCYGIGPSRIMGTLVEVFHDDKGMIWPEAVAPYRVHLVSLGKEPEAAQESYTLYEKLMKKGIEVLWDDRQDKGAGEKFGDADLIGIPFRVVVSKKTMEKKSVEVKKRSAAESSFVSEKELEKMLA